MAMPVIPAGLSLREVNVAVVADPDHSSASATKRVEMIVEKVGPKLNLVDVVASADRYRFA